MKKIIYTVAIMGVLVLLSGQLLAQHGQRDNKNKALYDPAKEETIKGMVVKVDNNDKWSGGGDKSGLFLTLETAKGTVMVHLGPNSFIKDKIKIEKGDTIEVTGSYIDHYGTNFFAARKVKKGVQEIVLRQNDGTPLWRGRPLKGK